MTWLRSYLPAFPSLTSLVKPPVLNPEPDSPPASAGRADKRRFVFPFPIRNELALLFSARQALRRRNTAPSVLAPVQPLPPSLPDKVQDRMGQDGTGQDRIWQDRMWQWKAVDKAVPVNHPLRSLLVVWHLAMYAGLPRASLSEHMHAHGASTLWQQGGYGAVDTQGAGADIRENALGRLVALAKKVGRPVEKKIYAHARHEDIIADISRHTENGGPCLVLWHAEATQDLVQMGHQTPPSASISASASTRIPAPSSAMTSRLIYGIRQHGGDRRIETLDLDRGLSRLALDTPAFWHDKSGGGVAAPASTAATGDYQISVQVYFFPANENALLRTASAPIARTRAGCKDRKQRPQSQPA